VCSGATDSQFKMFIEICKTTGLNPFLKEIWFVKGVGIMAARDGYLRVANDHPMFDGMETRVERDSKNVPVKAVCTVWRKDRNHPIVCEAYYNEYAKQSQVWQTYKSAMISKVAEVLALKRSFAINGVVTEEEIGTESERGSKEAAAKVAEKKLSRMKAGETYKEASESVVEDDLGVSSDDLAPILEASVKKAEADKFRALAAFQTLKKDIIDATGSDSLYYAALGALGYAKSNQIPNPNLRAAYKAVAQAFVDWRIDNTTEPTDEEKSGDIWSEVVIAYGDEQSAYRALGAAGFEKWAEVPMADKAKLAMELIGQVK
jgi:hypothetical protein